MGKASVTKMVNYNNSVDFCSFQVTWFMEVTVELTSNTLFFSRELKKKATRFKWKLEEGRLSKVFRTSHIIKKRTTFILSHTLA